MAQSVQIATGASSPSSARAARATACAIGGLRDRMLTRVLDGTGEAQHSP
jgi:hypothetical protein